jgi:hypothetical protein
MCSPLGFVAGTFHLLSAHPVDLLSASFQLLLDGESDLKRER